MNENQLTVSKDLTTRLANLSPGKRALLEKMLQDKGLNLGVASTIPRRTTGESVPLSFAQERLWFLSQLEPESHVYNESRAVSLIGSLNIKALENALKQIVARHEVLRTTIISINGIPQQIIDNNRSIELKIIDLKPFPDQERDTEANRLIIDTVRYPFDLSHEIPLRTLLLRLTEQEHILLVVKHHIASDGWSSGIFWRELTALYRAFSSGQPCPLSDLPIQYADYAIWQREWLQGKVLERQVSYWQKQLRNLKTLELPTDRPRPAVQSFRGAWQPLVLATDLSESLKVLSRKEGVTLFMTLLAAFQTLLHRHTGQEEIVVGSPIANRNRTEIEGLIGFFVNTLALRTDLSGNPTFRELLQRVRKTALEAYEHQDLPFEKLVEELNPGRNLSHSPLFQVVFVLQNTPSTRWDFKGLRVIPVRMVSETAKFDLTLSMHETAEGLRGSLRYNTDLFDDVTITRILGHFQNLLQEIITNPNEHIGTLSLVNRDERKQLTEVWSRTPAVSSQYRVLDQFVEERVPTTPGTIPVAHAMQSLTVRHIIEMWARRTPNAVAFEAPGRMPLTYGQLNSHMKTVLEQLRKLGINRNDRVALVLREGAEMAVAFLAVAAGATSAPLNPIYRPEEFEFYLNDIRAKAIIVQAGIDSSVWAVAERLGIPIIELSPKQNGEAGMFTLTSDMMPKSGCEEYAQSADIALVLHTSGTTARPKLVPLTHANLCTSALNIQSSLALRQDDRCLNIMPLFHIHGLVGALLSSLAAGASIICTPGFYAPDFLGWLEEFRPTWYTAVPTMHQAILARTRASLDHINRYPLRFIRSSSASLPQAVLKELEKIFHAPVIDSYGMTEAAHQISSNRFPPGQRKEGSVGVATGSDVAIMDSVGNLLKAGEPGEVVIRGPNVTLGYENDAIVDASAFTQGWFHTGDQGFLDTDGYLFLTGRFKEIINRGGEKISPLEVDQVLIQHPAVAQAVAFPVSDSRLGEEIAAAVVLREQITVTPAQLREFVATKLADFKVPRLVVIVDNIPLGPTGKVQRVGLAQQLGLRAIADTTTRERSFFEEPRTPTEKMLAEIWAELLRLERVGCHDNFFELGGDSLVAARIIARVQSAMHGKISMIDFFDNPTLAGLAASIERVRQIQHVSPSENLYPVVRATAFPLSFAQRALWFLDQIEPERWVYNRSEALRFTGAIDLRAMEQSLNEIVRRHEALRTSFPLVGDAPTQVIVPTQPISFSFFDLRHMTRFEGDLQARGLVRAEARRPFDLTRGPMLRAAVVKVSDGDHILLMTMHHIASDGWSSTIFWRELTALYNGITAGMPAKLPAPPIQYVDFAEWQRRYLKGEQLEKLLSYWKHQMDKGRLPRLPFLKHKSKSAGNTGHRGARQGLRIPNSLTQALKTFASHEQASLFMCLLAALKTLLYRYTGQTDLLVGTPIAGRNSGMLEGVIGNFANVILLRTDLSGDPTFRALLKRVRATTLQAYEHADLPLCMLAETLRGQQINDIGFPFEVMLNFRNFPSETVGFAGLQTAEFQFDDGIARFPLSLDVIEKSDGLSCFFEYDTGRVDKATITQLVGAFQALLEGVVVNPDRPIGAIPLPAAFGLRRPESVRTNVATDNQQHGGIHHLFEAQAERTPNAIAVAQEGTSLSYAGLNRRSNQLAHYLRQVGVCPDTLVGICVERSVNMAIGLLGILKAGGAFVPLDPAQPKERLAFIMEDTKIDVILTQEQLLDLLPPSKVQTVLLDADWPKIAQVKDTNPSSGTQQEHLAYVIYTSGSTGRPKGVLINHRGVINHSLAVRRHFALQAKDRVAQCTSLNFDISVEEMFPSWVSGATVILCPSRVFFPSVELCKWIAEEEIAVLNLPTAFWHAWLNELEKTQQSLPSTLRLVVVGGEKAGRQPLTRWHRLVGTNIRWINTYGPTEATVTTTVYEPISDADWHDEAAEIPIGRPITNSEVYVLDRYLQPAPIGMPGELHIGGHGLARGYLNQPGLTAERFIPHPFSSDAGARLYKTGDLVRYRPDANLEFLGRLDNQVKIRGFRIEPGEIECVLSQHLAVRDAVVLAHENNPGDRRLVAYVVSKQKPAPTVSELRSFIKEKLPEYMLPSAFMFLDALPLTPNGKLDRKALPAPDQTRPELDKCLIMPRDTIEFELTEIWEKLLGVKPIGVRNNFFDLGGHSLLAVRLFAEIEKALGRRLPVATIFQSPTIEQLSGILRQEELSVSQSSIWSAYPSFVVPFQPNGSKPPLFWLNWGYGDFRLPRYLGSEQPVYGLQHQSQDGQRALYTTIEEMAAHYIKEIQAVHAKGPYVLGGYCIGGMVAFEMARQFHKQGEEVALLVLLDPTTPRFGKVSLDSTQVSKLPLQITRFLSKVHRHLRELAPLKPQQRLNYALVRAKARIIGSGEKINRTGRRVLSEVFGRPLPLSLLIDYILTVYGRAARAYVPQAYRGRVILFKSQGQYRGRNSGWENFVVGGLEIQELDSNHNNVFAEPYVRSFAEKLKAALTDAASRVKTHRKFAADIQTQSRPTINESIGREKEIPLEQSPFIPLSLPPPSSARE